MMNRYRLSLFAVGLICNAVAANPPPITSCITDMSVVSNNEALVTNTSIWRVYVLCPNTTFSPGVSNEETGLVEGGQKPLVCKSNCAIRCGDDGLSSNNCVIDGTGTSAIFQVAYQVFDDLPKVTKNVFYQGITIDSFVAEGQRPVVVASFFGSVTFQDCIFSNNNANPMFILTEFIQSAATARIADIDAPLEKPPGFVWKGPGKDTVQRRNILRKNVESIDRSIVYDDGRSRRELRASDIPQQDGTKVTTEGDRILQTTGGFKVSFQKCLFEVSLHLYNAPVSV